jgi:hypothetical protein
MGQDRDEFTASVLKPEPVVAVTVTCNLGGERQMQLAAHFNRDASPDEQNEILDKVMKVADRQKARYDLEKLEENFNTCGLNTRNLLAGLPVADNVQKMQIGKLKVELQAKEEARKEVYEAGYNDHVSGHRRGNFEPKGNLKQRLAVMDADIQKVKDAIEAAPKDAAQEREKLVNTIRRHQEDLRLRRKVINDLRGLAGLSPNIEFEDAENEKV